MWWYLKKFSDNTIRICYNYSLESKDLDGRIIYDKESKTFETMRHSKGDTFENSERLYPHIYNMIFNENAPDEKMIATG
jgi:hypothetical protein